MTAAEVGEHIGRKVIFTYLHGERDEGVVTSLADQVGGRLNPLWVEWLMGYPPGWTDCAA